MIIIWCIWMCLWFLMPLEGVLYTLCFTCNLITRENNSIDPIEVVVIWPTCELFPIENRTHQSAKIKREIFQQQKKTHNLFGNFSKFSFQSYKKNDCSIILSIFPSIFPCGLEHWTNWSITFQNQCSNNNLLSVLGN